MPIPKNAKRVFKGKIFDVYHWSQKMFDGSLETFERIKRPDTVIIIATFKNKLVVLRQRQPKTGWFYSSPAGRMDKKGESPKRAALRELLEETGMRPKKLLFWRKIKKIGKVDYTVHFFIARDCAKVATQKLDPGEKIEVKLMSFEQFLKLSEHKPSQHWLGETLIDMYKARLDKKYKGHLKKVFFG